MKRMNERINELQCNVPIQVVTMRTWKSPCQRQFLNVRTMWLHIKKSKDILEKTHYLNTSDHIIEIFLFLLEYVREFPTPHLGPSYVSLRNCFFPPQEIRISVWGFLPYLPLFHLLRPLFFYYHLGFYRYLAVISSWS